MGRILRIAKTEIARLKLDRDVWEWLKNWPPEVEPMPSNEPGATEAESILGWNHFMRRVREESRPCPVASFFE